MWEIILLQSGKINYLKSIKGLGGKIKKPTSFFCGNGFKMRILGGLRFLPAKVADRVNLKFLINFSLLFLIHSKHLNPKLYSFIFLLVFLKHQSKNIFSFLF